MQFKGQGRHNLMGPCQPNQSDRFDTSPYDNRHKNLNVGTNQIRTQRETGGQQRSAGTADLVSDLGQGQVPGLGPSRSNLITPMNSREGVNSRTPVRTYFTTKPEEIVLNGQDEQSKKKIDDNNHFKTGTNEDEENSDSNEVIDTTQVSDDNLYNLNEENADFAFREQSSACPYCQLVAPTKEGLRNHINELHIPKEFPCHLCDFRTTDRMKHGDHITNTHQIQLKVKDGQEIPSHPLVEAFKSAKKMSHCAFKTLLNKEEFSEVEVPGNGFCFSSSLLVALSEFGINKAYDILSLDIMTEIDRYYESVINDTGQSLGNKEEFKAICASFFESGNYTHDFVDICIGSAANGLGINLNIFQKTGNSVEKLTFNCAKFKSKINLSLFFYNRKSRRNTDCHYNVLLRTEYYKRNEQAVKSRMVRPIAENQIRSDWELAQKLSPHDDQDQIKNDFQMAKHMQEGSSDDELRNVQGKYGENKDQEKKRR